MMDGGKKITKYVIEYKLTSSEEDSWFQKQVAAPQNNQVTVSGLIENEEYSVRFDELLPYFILKSLLV